MNHIFWACLRINQTKSLLALSIVVTIQTEETSTRRCFSIVTIASVISQMSPNHCLYYIGKLILKILLGFIGKFKIMYSNLAILKIVDELVSIFSKILERALHLQSVHLLITDAPFFKEQTSCLQMSLVAYLETLMI